MKAPNAEHLAEFAVGLRFADLPPAVVDRARWIIADTVGCMLGARATDIGTTMVDALAALGGRADATIVGTPHRADCVTAAFANAVLADTLDYEETLLGHPSATAVPAALAVGEHRGASGAELISAVVAGFEIGVRLARAIWPSPERGASVAVMHTWHGFCAAVAAGRLLNLGVDQFLDAFGYVGASTPLPLWYTKVGRPCHWLKGNYGEMARAGVLAAFMGRAGILTPRRILDEDLGFARMAGSDVYRAEELFKGLGDEWVILETAFKPYPACRYIHTTLDAVSALVAQHRIVPSAIEAVHVRAFSEMTKWFGDPRPVTTVDAQFSVQYLVALVLLGRTPGPEWYAAETRRDPVVMHLADRVRLETDPECDALYWQEWRHATKVEIVTRDRQRLCVRRDWPRGAPEYPLSEAELTEKFLTLAGTVLSADASTAALAECLEIDRRADVRPLMVRLAV